MRGRGLHVIGRLSRQREGDVVAALDIGSSKVCCLIAAVVANPKPMVDAGAPRWRLKGLGFGHQRAMGIEAGTVVDLALAQAAVSGAIARAERMANLEIDSIFVAANCGNPRSFTFSGHFDLHRGTVQRADVAALAAGAQAYALRRGGGLLALNRIGFRLDGVAVGSDPRGLAGRRLTADHHAVVVDDGPLRNVSQLVEACHLDLAGVLPGALASGLAVTTEEERKLGVTVIDIGGGVSAMAGFAGGHYVMNDVYPAGGLQITNDIAAALEIPVVEAERIKTLYGNVTISPSDEHEYIDLAGGSPTDWGGRRVTNAQLGRVVRQRVWNLLQDVEAALARSPCRDRVSGRIVLTGGTSQLLGFELYARAQFGLNVRAGAPPKIAGLATGPLGPGFAAVVGACIAGIDPQQWLVEEPGGAIGEAGYLRRVGRWLQDSF